MPRKGLRPRERRPDPAPDFRYHSVLLSRFINKINFCGKKTTVERVVYRALDHIREKGAADPLAVFDQAVENVRPVLEVRPRRVGGATYQVPMEVAARRGATLAMRWLIRAAREKKGRPLFEGLSEEISSASRKEGTAFKKREDTHRMAESNRAFAHYRW
ncbi:MAG: 30S ribosomal protein S7 [Elusimicrobia bacterium]|nr:30S ribosomal protein S7 [Elusimicrobiota bacterium]